MQTTLSLVRQYYHVHRARLYGGDNPGAAALRRVLRKRLRRRARNGDGHAIKVLHATVLKATKIRVPLMSRLRGEQ